MQTDVEMLPKHFSKNPQSIIHSIIARAHPELSTGLQVTNFTA
jgi:hypothetical protein